MSDRKVHVDTDALRAAAGRMDDIASRVWNTLTGLRTTLDDHGFPWGHDSFGKKFTEGEKGYTVSRDNLLDGSTNMVRSLNQFSGGMKDAAKKMDDMDH
ncbi:WXG100 family type VII secretion target [Nocardia sp. NPDC004068]|uniref:WXG100 family type VII secretion target n=1 Tax=Nocardia sp. NPDC004068 TaxID=3364303 RepID=UPI00368FC040